MMKHCVEATYPNGVVRLFWVEADTREEAIRKIQTRFILREPVTLQYVGAQEIPCPVEADTQEEKTPAPAAQTPMEED